MQQQEKNFQPAHIAACRDRFEAAMAGLEREPAPPPAPPPPAPMVEPMPGPYTVYFDFDRAELTPDAQAALSAVIQSAQQSGAQSIDIPGYTALSGPEAYTQVLSARRAKPVHEVLVRRRAGGGASPGAGTGGNNPEGQT